MEISKTLPTVRLRMPGCYLTNNGANEAARDYFLPRATEDLSRKSDDKTLCDILGGPSGLAQWCPFELAFEEFSLDRRPPRDFAAFSYGRGSDPTSGPRLYDLFLMSTRKTQDEHEVDVDLPPVSFQVRIEDYGDPPNKAHSASRLQPIPEGVKVSIKGFDYERTIASAELGTHLLELNTIRQFFEKLLQSLDQMSPHVAWKRLSPSFYPFTGSISDSVTSLFEETAATSKDKDVVSEIKDYCKHPLDAPVLMTKVYPDLWELGRKDGVIRDSMRQVEGVGEQMDYQSTSTITSFHDSLRQMTVAQRFESRETPPEGKISLRRARELASQVYYLTEHRLQEERRAEAEFLLEGWEDEDSPSV